MVREGLCEKAAFKLRMRDEKELSRGRVEGKVFHTRVIWKGRQGWVLVGPVGHRRQSLDFILIVVKCHMPQKTLRKG